MRVRKHPQHDDDDTRTVSDLICTHLRPVEPGIVDKARIVELDTNDNIK